MEKEIFGKRILFTDRTDWPVTDVVAAYRSHARAEAGFRQLKDRADRPINRGCIAPGR